MAPISERVFMASQGDGPKRSIINKAGEYIPYMAESDMSDSNFIPVTMQKAYEIKRPNFVPKLDL